jgi:hypothetical protein
VKVVVNGPSTCGSVVVEVSVAVVVVAPKSESVPEVVVEAVAVAVDITAVNGLSAILCLLASCLLLLMRVSIAC